MGCEGYRTAPLPPGAAVNRAQVLDTAKAHVTVDRAATHGELEDTFQRTADLWNAYLGEWADIQPHDVANMMTLLKVARARGNPAHEDNYVDMAGYSSCAGELAEEAKMA